MHTKSHLCEINHIYVPIRCPSAQNLLKTSEDVKETSGISFIPFKLLQFLDILTKKSNLGWQATHACKNFSHT